MTDRKQPVLTPRDEVNAAPPEARQMMIAAMTKRDTNYGMRVDGTPKGKGFFGELPRKDDPSMISTELSMDVDIGGENILLPLIVPTLSRAELDHLLAGKDPTPQMIDKAVAHALERKRAGKNPFADEGEQVPVPPTEAEDFQRGADEVMRRYK